MGQPPPVAIVNEQFVRRYLPQGNPLGQHITVDSEMELSAWSRTPYQTA
jgi:hypothetical protein